MCQQVARIFGPKLHHVDESLPGNGPFTLSKPLASLNPLEYHWIHDHGGLATVCMSETSCRAKVQKWMGGWKTITGPHLGGFHVGARPSQLQPYLAVAAVGQIVRPDAERHPEYPLHRAVQGRQGPPQHPDARELILHLRLSSVTSLVVHPFFLNRWLMAEHTEKHVPVSIRLS